VLGHDPWKQYRLHPDHHRGGQLTVDGIVAARDPHFFPGVGTPHRPARLLLFEAQVVDHVEPVEEADLRTKIDALLCHRSQWRSTMHIDERASDVDAQVAAFRQRIEDEIAAAGGEAFKLLTDL
jgi:LmbE family N-acetylglucosaminyl deacetylase